MSDNDASIPAPAPAPEPSRRSRWLIPGIGVGLLIVGMILVATRLPQWLASEEGGGGAGEISPLETADRKIQATLFYVSSDGGALVPVSREVRFGATPEEQIKRILEALTGEPPAGQRSAIPKDTTVRAVFLNGSTAYVDLGGAIVSGHSGGSLDEALAVYAIVNAVTMNLPDVTSVQILVEGKEVETLVGHLDLRSPLAKTTDWIKKGSARE